MSELENKLLARRLLEEVVNTGSVDRLPEFLAIDCIAPWIKAKGLTWFREHLRAWHECYPGFVVNVDGQVAEDETVITWWTMRGTHSGAWDGLAPTHKPILLRGVNIQKVRNGRIVEHCGGSNSLDVLLELGLVKWTIDPKEASPKGSPGTSSKCAPRC